MKVFFPAAYTSKEEKRKDNNNVVQKLTNFDALEI